MAIFLPLRSSTVLIGPPAFTLMTISTGAPDNGAMPFIGAPLTIMAMSVPPSRPMSIAPAVMPWIKRGPPPKAEELDGQAVLFEDAGLHSDFKQRVGERRQRRFADAKRLGLRLRAVGDDRANDHQATNCPANRSGKRHGHLHKA